MQGESVTGAGTVFAYRPQRRYLVAMMVFFTGIYLAGAALVAPSFSFFLRPPTRVPQGFFLATIPIFLMAIVACRITVLLIREHGATYQLTGKGLERTDRRCRRIFIPWSGIDPRYNEIAWRAGGPSGTIELLHLEEPARFASELAEQVLRANGRFEKETDLEWLGPPRWCGWRMFIARDTPAVVCAGLPLAITVLVVPAVPILAVVCLPVTLAIWLFIAWRILGNRNLRFRVTDDGAEVRGFWLRSWNGIRSWSQLDFGPSHPRAAAFLGLFPDPDQLWAYYYLVYGGWHKHRSGQR